MKLTIAINGKAKEFNFDEKKAKENIKTAASHTVNGVAKGVKTLLSTAVEGLNKANAAVKVDPEYEAYLQLKKEEAEAEARRIAEAKARIKEIKASI